MLWEEKESQEEQNGSISLGDPADPMSHWTIHYLFVNGNGDPVSDEFTRRASISDCCPIVSGGKVVFYTSSYNTLDFYMIDAKSGAFSKKTHRVAGENISWNMKDGVLSFEGSGEITSDNREIYKTTLSSTGMGNFYSNSDTSWKYIRDDATEVTIGEGITSIGRMAFWFFDHTAKLNLPESLVKIDSYAFKYCQALKSVRIPDGVSEFGNDLFWNGYSSGITGKHVYDTAIYAKCTAPAIQYAKDCGMSYKAEHQFGEPRYTWSADNKECTGWCPCNYNPKHGQKEVANTKAEGDWLVAEFTKTVFTKQKKELPEGWLPDDAVDISGKDVLYVDYIETKVYNGKPRIQEPDISTDDDWLYEGTDYTLTYENNVDVGRATVIITGIGKYYGTVKKTFKIIPKGTSISSVKKAKKALKVKWKKQAAQTTGYEIQYSLKRNFKSAKTVRIANTATTSKKIKKLKSKKYYYVRVRTYKTVNGTDYFSRWSGVKKMKTK